MSKKHVGNPTLFFRAPVPQAAAEMGVIPHLVAAAMVKEEFCCALAVLGKNRGERGWVAVIEAPRDIPENSLEAFKHSLQLLGKDKDPDFVRFASDQFLNTRLVMAQWAPEGSVVARSIWAGSGISTPPTANRLEKGLFSVVAVSADDAFAVVDLAPKVPMAMDLCLARARARGLTTDKSRMFWLDDNGARPLSVETVRGFYGFNAELN